MSLIYNPYRKHSIGRAIPQTLISDSLSPAVSTFHFVHQNLHVRPNTFRVLDKVESYPALQSDYN
jgi:hypothetical protein